MKKLSKLLLVIMLFVLCPQVEAQTIEHFYGKAGNDIALEDDANASVAIAGNSIDVDSKIDGIALLAGDTINLKGNSEYAITIGNNINLEGTVNKDAFIGGNLIKSSKSAKFNRDVIMGGGEVEISGTFARNVSIYATNVIVEDANVDGHLKLYAQNIEIKSGNIEYLSYPKDATVKINDDANINETEKTAPINKKEENTYLNTITSKVWSFACYALIFAVICLLLPNVITKMNDKYQKLDFNGTIPIFTKGLVLIISIPIISILLFITAIGLPLGIITFILYFIAIYLSTIFTAYLLGYKIWQKLFNKDMNMLLIGLIGLLVLLILNLIPGINYLVSILTVLIGLGLIFDIIKSSH